MFGGRAIGVGPEAWDPFGKVVVKDSGAEVKSSISAALSFKILSS
jgi:hypothetical protein